jgi:hypothetical protein
MPYRITRYADDLLWVVMDGQLSLDHADAYFHELWSILDGSPDPTDLLVDGRRIGGASSSARRRTEQVAHHPHLGHLAFVVSEHHMLLFAPFVKLVSGVGLFGHEYEALAYLRAARGLPPVSEADLPNLPPPAELEPEHGHRHEHGHGHSHHGEQPGVHGRHLPPPPASRIPLSGRVLPHRHAGPHTQRALPPGEQPSRPVPPPPAPRLARPRNAPPGLLGSLTEIVEGWARGRHDAGSGDGES